MKHKKVWTGIGAFAGMLILILDSRTALSGARTGLDLVLKTVIPSLFPFIFLSIVLTDAYSGTSLSILKPVGKLFRLPEGAEMLLLPAFLGGYPAGAQAVCSAYRRGCFSTENGRQLLAFCNNAGPSFLFGMISGFFPDLRMVWILWAIHIFSAWIAAQFFPCTPERVHLPSENRASSLSSGLQATVKVMAVICGWVILFRIVIAFLDRWILWVLPVSARTAVIGLLELSNGCCALGDVIDLRLRFVLCSGMLAMGGLCVAMQTASVVGELSLGRYLPGKLLQTAFSIGISFCIVYRFWLPLGILSLISLVLLGKRKKSSSIPRTVGV